MIAKQTTWSRVQVGDFIRAKDGKTWKVKHRRDDGYWGLVSRDGDELILTDQQVPPTAPVAVYYLSQDELEKMLVDELGAETVAVQYDGEGVYYCPPWEGKRIEEMKSHLLLMHGISATSANDPGQSAGMNSKKALTECHEEQHRSPGSRWTPHVHESTLRAEWPDDNQEVPHVR